MLRLWKVMAIEQGAHAGEMPEARARVAHASFCSQGDRGFDGQSGPKGDQGEKGERVS